MPEDRNDRSDSARLRAAAAAQAAIEDHKLDSDPPPSAGAWKKRDGKSVTLDQIHVGLLALAEHAEASIETSLKLAADVADVARTSDIRTEQLNNIRRDVQFLKDDMREVKDVTSQIPAIKSLLMEILSRLPEPSV